MLRNLTTLLIFWATWCKPCIQELPHFEKMREEYAKKNVRFSLVSLDFNDKLENFVKPFIVKKDFVNFEHYLMNNLDYDKWIDLVDKSWQGAIPATLFS